MRKLTIYGELYLKDEDFGSELDFKELVDECHKKNIKIILILNGLD